MRFWLFLCLFMFASGAKAQFAMTNWRMPNGSLAISNGPTYNFGTLGVSATIDKTFVVTVDHGRIYDLQGTTFSAAPFTYKNGTYPGTGGDCGASLQAYGTCSVVVTATSVTSGTFNSSLILPYNSSSGTTSIERALYVVFANPPLIIAPNPMYIETNASNTFTATGGGTLYTYAIVSGGGVIDSVTGDYDAPASAQTVRVKVTDEYAVVSNGTAFVYVPLSMTPATVTLQVLGNQTFTATGGFGTKTFSLVSGVGSINVSTGAYTAPATIGVATVAVTDSIGNSDTSDITVVNSLQISPSLGTLAVYDKLNFTGTLGVSPYTYSVFSGFGSINTSLGTFSAGGTLGTSVIRLTDSAATISHGTITVVEPLQFTINGAQGCVLYSNNLGKCWGSATYGQIGSGATAALGDAATELGSKLAFLDLGSGRTIKKIRTGMYHTCAILDNDDLKCWGRNNFGQLGYGDVNNRGDNASEMSGFLFPIDLGSPRYAKDVYPGWYHTCAILDNNETKCWGRNDFGQLGQGSTVTVGTLASQMGTALPVTSWGTSGQYPVEMSMSEFQTCARLSDGTMKCYGQSTYAQLGQGTTSTMGDSPGETGAGLPPINLGTGRTALSIGAGRYHTCAVLDNQKVKCWGRNNNGQLGRGNTTTVGTNPSQLGDGLTEIDFGAVSTVAALTVGLTHNCALLTDGNIKCWGQNNRGQLGIGLITGTSASIGDGTLEMSTNLQTTNIGSGITTTNLYSGNTFSCAMTSQKRFKCWGFGSSGQLLIGSTANIGDGAGEMGDPLQYIKATGN